MDEMQDLHELQHIRRALSRGEWADNLKNMKERGTPMTDAEMSVILDYLSTYYNREKQRRSFARYARRRLRRSDPEAPGYARRRRRRYPQVDKRVVGPSFKEVAARYAGDAVRRNGSRRKSAPAGKACGATCPCRRATSLSEASAQGRFAVGPAAELAQR